MIAPVRTVTPQAPVRTELRVALDLARDLPQLTDPMRAEYHASAALTEAAVSVSSTAWVEELPPGTLVKPDRRRKPGLTDPRAMRFDGSTEHELWTGLADAIVAAPTRRGLALLCAMAVVLPDGTIAGTARQRAAQLAGGGLPRPAWADALAGLEPDECWLGSQGPGYPLAVISHRYGSRRHAVVILIDDDMGGVAKNAFQTEDVDRTLAEIGSLRPADPARVHKMIRDAYEAVYAYRDLPVDPDVHRLRLVAYRRTARFAK